jgi:hypothetical protein
MANAPALNQQALDQLRKHIDAALASPHATVAAAAAAAPALGPQDFCKVWPQAKPILQAVSGIIALIPGFGPTAAAALAALLTVGDQVFNSTCQHQ